MNKLIVATLAISVTVPAANAANREIYTHESYELIHIPPEEGKSMSSGITIAKTTAGDASLLVGTNSSGMQRVSIGYPVETCEGYAVTNMSDSILVSHALKRIKVSTSNKTFTEEVRVQCKQTLDTEQSSHVYIQLTEGQQGIDYVELLKKEPEEITIGIHTFSTKGLNAALGHSKNLLKENPYF